VTALNFTNRFSENLPADKESENYTRQVPHSAFSYVLPKQVSSPKLVAKSDCLVTSLGLDELAKCSETLAQVFTGNQILDGMEPYAMCYGGHQFGHWAGQLGDGRAINLGEIKTENSGFQTLQLKGAGPTPYSRGADGFAVLRSSVREFLCSEAMFHLGIPTTRALTLCLTGDKVERDMFYNGNAKYEQGAIVCRVSSSFLRFGSFQLPYSRKDLSLLKTLVDYCIEHDYPHLGAPNKGSYIQWLTEISERTCELVIHWMRVGFVHGVLNTDNMSILGETIDYGPYGWIDNFDLNWTPNTTDRQNRRYCFGAQPDICRWNLFQLANAIYPLIEDVDALQKIIDDFNINYQKQWREMMANKLGLKDFSSEDDSFFKALEQLLYFLQMDMTIFYRLLADFQLTHSSNSMNSESILSFFESCFYDKNEIDEEDTKSLLAWLTRYLNKLEKEKNQSNDERKIAMNKVNPKYVLRNYLAQQAIDRAEQGDFSEIRKLQKILEKPYEDQPDFEAYAQKRPEWAKNKAGCSMLSCSS